MANETILIPIGLDAKNISKEVQALTKQIEKIPNKNVKVNLDTKDATKQASNLDKELSKIDSVSTSVEIDTKNSDKRIKDLNSEIEDLYTELIKSEKVAKNYESTIDSLTGELKSSEKAFDSLQSQIDALTNELTASNAEIDKFKNTSKDIGDNAEKSGSKFKSLAGNVGGVGIALGGIAAAGLGFLVSEAIDLDSEMRKLQASTGQTAEEFAKTSETATELFRKGIGESVTETTKALTIAQKQLGGFLDTENVNKFVESVGGAAQVFDKDLNEVIEKSRTFIGAFGLDGEQAANLVNIGLRDAGSQADDFLDTISEYSPLMAEAGASAEQFTSILVTGIQNGARDTDRLADAIKETGIRIAAGDFKGAFEGLSEGATQAEKDVINTLNGIATAAQKGDISIVDALGLSATEIQKQLDAGAISESLAKNLQVAIAGTPAEELGVSLFNKVYSSATSPDAIANLQSEAEKATAAFTEAIKPKGFDALVKDLQATLAGIAQPLIAAVQPVFDVIQTSVLPLLTTALTQLFPLITQIFGTLGGVVTNLSAVLVPVFENLLPIVNQVISDLASGLVPVIEELFTGLAPILSQLAELVGAILPLVPELLSAILPLVTALLKIASPLLTIIVQIANALVKVLLPVIEVITDAIGALVNGIGKGIVAFGELIGLIDKEADSTKKNVDAKKEASKENAKLTDSQKKLLIETEKSTVATDDLSKSQINNVDAGKKQKETLETVVKQLVKLNLAGKESSETYDNLISKAVGYTKAKEAEKTALDAVNKAIADAITNENEILNLQTKLIETSGDFAFLESLQNLGKEVDITKTKLEDLTVTGEQYWINLGVASELASQAIIDSFASIDEQQSGFFDGFNAGIEGMEANAANIGTAFGEVVAETGDLLQGIGALATEALKSFIEAAVPAWVAGIFGTTVAQLGPLGVGVAAALTALLKGLVSTALGAESGDDHVGRGVKRKPGRTDKHLYMLADDEAVINAKAANKYRPMLKAMNRGDDSSVAKAYVDIFGDLQDFKPNPIYQNIERIVSYPTQPDKVILANTDNTAYINELRHSNKLLKEQNKLLTEMNYRLTTTKTEIEHNYFNKYEVKQAVSDYRHRR